MTFFHAADRGGDSIVLDDGVVLCDPVDWVSGDDVRDDFVGASTAGVPARFVMPCGLVLEDFTDRIDRLDGGEVSSGPAGGGGSLQRIGVTSGLVRASLPWDAVVGDDNTVFSATGADFPRVGELNEQAVSVPDDQVAGELDDRIILALNTQDVDVSSSGVSNGQAVDVGGRLRRIGGTSGLVGEPLPWDAVVGDDNTVFSATGADFPRVGELNEQAAGELNEQAAPTPDKPDTDASPSDVSSSSVGDVESLPAFRQSAAVLRENPDAFVHLHNHSEHSPLDGLIRTAELPKLALADGASHVGITDHGSIDGWFKFHQACNKEGVVPIYGEEMYLALLDRHTRDVMFTSEDDEASEAEESDSEGKRKTYYHLTVLAGTEQGYRNLLRMHNEAENSYWRVPRIDYPLLKEYGEGLIVLTGCVGGPVAGTLARSALEGALQAALEGDRERALDLGLRDLQFASIDSVDTHIELLQQAFDSGSTDRLVEAIEGLHDLVVANNFAQAQDHLDQIVDAVGKDNVYVEVMDHGIGKEERSVERLVKLARDNDLPLVASNDCHYAHESDAHAHDGWLCVRTKKTVADTDRFKFSGSGYHYRSGVEMRGLRSADWWKEACDNTVHLAARITGDYTPKPQSRLPHFPLPEGVTDSPTYLRELATSGIIRLVGEDPDRPGKPLPEYEARLEEELPVIVNAGTTDYFLILWDLISWAVSDRGIPNDEFPEGEPGGKVPIRVGKGRGSAAGCAIAYGMGITAIDPLDHGLLFERFLNPERAGLPDIDTDFERHRIDEVFSYLMHKYGSVHVARIGTFGVSRSKAALKDAGRVLGQPSWGIRLAELMPVLGATPAGLSQVFDPPTPGDVSAQTVYDLGAPARNYLDGLGSEGLEIVQVAKAMENVVRNTSIHACATLVADEPLENIVPLRYQRAEGGAPRLDLPRIVGWEGGSVEQMGLLKLDVLAIKTLDIITLASQYAAELESRSIVIPELKAAEAPYGRAGKAFEITAKGDTAGVFQLGSRGMQELAREVAPTALDDLTALVALYRPGPMGAGMPQRYADRKHGREPVSYDYLTSNPAEVAVIKPILDPTYGVICYQETLMQLGGAVGGLSSGMRNTLQKAFSKKKKDLMDQVREAFYTGGLAGTNPTSTPFSGATLDALWRAFEASAEYLFNKCLVGETVLVNEHYLPVTVEDLYLQSLEDAWDGEEHLVFAYNTRTRKTEPQKVEDVHHLGEALVFDIVLESRNQIRATEDHRFLTKDRGWRRLGELTLDDCLLVEVTPGDDVASSRVFSITPVGVMDVYDVEMGAGTDHNFLANNIVTHNSHAAAYGVTAYETAYLKANWPTAYDSAVLAMERSDDKRRATLRSLQDEQIQVYAPDINHSKEKTAPYKDGVIIGLSEIKGVGKAGAAIVADREERGEYRSLAEMRVRLSEDKTRKNPLTALVLTALVEAGAADSFGSRVPQMVQAKAPSGTPADVEWGILEKSLRQRRRLGFTTGVHPLHALRQQILDELTVPDQQVLRSMGSAIDAPDRARVTIVALLTAFEKRTGRKSRFATYGFESSSRQEITGIQWQSDLERMEADGEEPQVGDIVLVRGKTRHRVFEREVTHEDGSITIETTHTTELNVVSVAPIHVRDEMERSTVALRATKDYSDEMITFDA